MLPVILHPIWGSQLQKLKNLLAQNANAHFAQKCAIFKKCTQAKSEAKGYLEVIQLRNLGAEVI